MYEIKVLTNDQMDNARAHGLGCECVDEDNMGFADKNTNTVYVRYSKHPELMKAVIDHELEHLVESEHEGTHECAHGVRHKKFFKQLFLPMITAGISGLVGGGPGGAVAGAASGALSSLNKPKAPTPSPTPQISAMQQGPQMQQPSMTGPVTSRLSTGLTQPMGGGSPLNAFKPSGASQQEFDPERPRNQAGFYQGRDPYRINF